MPSRRSNGPAERKIAPARKTWTLPERKRGLGHGRDPLQRICYVLRQSPSYFAACLRAERTAASMALLVTVAPATPSIWALWAASTCWA